MNADIVHVMSRYEPLDFQARRRIAFAEQTWRGAFYSKGVKPVHVWDDKYPRNSGAVGDDRKTAYLKDMLIAGLDSVKHDLGLIILTNDDTVLHPDILGTIVEKMKTKEYTCSFRQDYEGQQDIEDVISGRVKMTDSPGRDLFVFKNRWLKNYLHEIPDYILGTTDWDYVLGFIMRRFAGTVIDSTTIVACDPKVDLPTGQVYHEYHQPWWRDNLTSPVQMYNKKLTYEYLCRFGYNERLYGARLCDLGITK